MKRYSVLLGLAVLLLAFVLIAPTLATPYTSTLTISNNGKIWRVPLIGTNADIDVIGAKAYYSLADASTDPPTPIAGEHLLVWERMQKHSDGITLYFDSASIQNVYSELAPNIIVGATSVIPITPNGDADPVSGPGFAWGRTR